MAEHLKALLSPTVQHKNSQQFGTRSSQSFLLSKPESLHVGLRRRELGHKVSLLVQGQRSSRIWRRQANFIDETPPWTLDQIAGLAFGVFILISIYAGNQIDVIVARSQRRDLGLCVECGGLFKPDFCTESRCPVKSHS